MEKYYTPAIEDIFIGYECEHHVDPYSDYIPCKITEGSDFEYVRDGEWILRTPYLTQEQIEAEGWREIHWREYLNKDNTVHFFNGEKESEDDTQYLSTFSLHNKKNVLFEGKCPSINEFRKICKLLNI